MVTYNSLQWLLTDLNLTKEEWEKLTYVDVLKLPIIKKLHLRAAGGRVRFPGSEVEDTKFTFCINKNCEHKGGRLTCGELVSGYGKNLDEAIKSAVQTAIELVGLRGERK
jgi:hypothetical protein